MNMNLAHHQCVHVFIACCTLLSCVFNQSHIANNACSNLRPSSCLKHTKQLDTSRSNMYVSREMRKCSNGQTTAKTLKQCNAWHSSNWAKNHPHRIIDTRDVQVGHVAARLTAFWLTRKGKMKHTYLPGQLIPIVQTLRSLVPTQTRDNNHVSSTATEPRST